jgi:hypothetical protein
MGRIWGQGFFRFVDPGLAGDFVHAVGKLAVAGQQGAVDGDAVLGQMLGHGPRAGGAAHEAVQHQAANARAVRLGSGGKGVGGSFRWDRVIGLKGHSFVSNFHEIVANCQLLPVNCQLLMAAAWQKRPFRATIPP